jgi:hypothetical protein
MDSSAFAGPSTFAKATADKTADRRPTVQGRPQSAISEYGGVSFDQEF